MTKREIAAEAARLLECGEAAAELAAGSATSAEAKRFMKAASLTVAELTEEYVRVECEETFTVKDRTILLSQLRNPPARILSVTDEEGRRLHYLLSDTRIELTEPAGRVSVRYARSLAGAGEAEELGLPVPLRAASFGAAAEFLLMSARYEEAALYYKRYQDAVLSTRRKRAGRVLPAPEWK